MEKEREIQVEKILIKASRQMLRSNDPTSQYCLLCAEVTQKFCTDTISHVMKKWVELDKGTGKLPTSKQLVSECFEFEKCHEKKIKPSDLELRCRYFFIHESIESKSFCSKIVSEEDMFFSKLQFGEIFCGWHQQCAYAKKYPDSVAHMHVKETLVQKRYFDGLKDQNFKDFIEKTQGAMKICLKNAWNWPEKSSSAPYPVG